MESLNTTILLTVATVPIMIICMMDFGTSRALVFIVEVVMHVLAKLKRSRVMLTNNEQLLVITGTAILLGMLVVAVIWLLSIELNKGE